RRLAVVAAAALAASGAGLYAARARPLRLEGALAADLERLHLRSFSRAEPCEFQSDDPARVAGWLESALGYRVDVPSMPGATLLGARRCNVAGEPAAHLLYRVGDHALTVIVPAAGSGAAKATARFASNGPRCTEGPLGEGICVVPEAAQTAVAVSDVAPPALLSLLDPRRR
uniref:anti-sigma factor n=1 Tax=Anaeromyxobacter terrae TaxID=2925406 RepID=UPI001F57367B